MVLNDMASIDILPSELIDEGNDFNENPVGTGPYCFVEWNRGDNRPLRKRFFDTEHQPSMRPSPGGSFRRLFPAPLPSRRQVDFIMEVETPISPA